MNSKNKKQKKKILPLRKKCPYSDISGPDFPAF